MNILLIMCDSLAAQFCSVYGDRAGATPHLQKLAETGVTFDRAYCNSPLCTPSRASCMTGRHVSEIGALDNAGSFSTEWPTLGHNLGGVGYDTAIIGKMHFVGHDQHHGFDQRIALNTDYAFGHRVRDYQLAYDWDQPSAGNPIGKNWMGPSYVQRPNWDFFPLHYDRDEQIHAEALTYLDKRRGQDAPFFACASYHAPHNPFWIPERFRERFAQASLDLPTDVRDPACIMDRWLNDFHHVPEIAEQLQTPENLRWLYETFYGMVLDLDQRVGELLERLEVCGLADSTAVVFTSDHGDMMGQRGMIQKRYFYEPAVRVPLIARLPGAAPRAAGSRIDTPVSLIDMLPTFAELASTPAVPGVPGRSLAGAMQTGETLPSKTQFCEYHGEGVHAPCFLAIRDQYKLIHIHGHDECFFDLADDPGELTNRIDDPPHQSTIESMRNELLAQFDPPAIDRAARQSQQNRKTIFAAAQASGKLAPPL